MNVKSSKYILWYKDIFKDDIPLVGGKNASLGEMFSKLTKNGINVPNGFAMTTKAYWYFLKSNKIDERLEKIFRGFDSESFESLKKTGFEAQQLILNGKFPLDLAEEIIVAYHSLAKKYGPNSDMTVAIRSSGVCEDMPQASFAGQFETFLNVSGEKQLLKAIKECFASTFTERAISYREKKKIPHLRFALSVGVQKMVRSDLACSGVIFTLDTETGFQNIVLINSVYGVGEMIVKGRITPDEFYVFKPTLKQGYKAIITRNLGRKNKKYIYNNKSGGLKEVSVSPEEQLKFSISDDDVLTLARWACLIEEHYNRPQDIEWAKDGLTGQLFIVQARPETVHAEKKERFYEKYELSSAATQKPILTGIAVGSKITRGKNQIISDVSQIGRFKKGQVLVTRMTDPDWVPAIKIASAVITDEGGRTCFNGKTKILTSKGFLPIEKITEIFKTEDIKVLSLNRGTLQLEWKRVIDGMKKKGRLLSINISQSGKMKGNLLKVTPDHKFLTFCNRELLSEEIQNLLKKQRCVMSLQQIPSIKSEKGNLSSNLSYFLGGLFTDGHVHLSRSHGEVQFIQKRTPEKIKFINKMNKCLNDLFQYQFHQTADCVSEGIIRGKPIKGSANRYRCYSKKIATYIIKKRNRFSEELLIASEESLYNFLAGVIDGDGTYNEKKNRINIFCSKKELFEAISIACLRLGISFQVSKNRTIWNIQIVDKVRELLKYTYRVKGQYKRLKFGTRFFSAKQLIEDIIDKVNYQGRIRPYVQNNFLIDAEKIRNYIIPMIRGQAANHELTKILNSPLRMLRVKLEESESLAEAEDVFNIEVEDNHNYTVFTDRYTAVLVENCHAAIVSRELGIPAIVGTKKATRMLKNEETVTVDCASKIGKIFQGEIPFKVKRYNLEKIPKLKTKIMMNVGAPETAFKNSFLPHRGVGLARIEFILSEKIRVHPLALYHYEKIKSGRIEAIAANSGNGNNGRKNGNNLVRIVADIDRVANHYQDKKQFFIDKLAEGIAEIAGAFWPEQVIVRLSDFKTNEYRNLIGGQLFEGAEANPMLGFRGACRYLDKDFQPAFQMECRAIKKVREEMGLKNIVPMVPFCRTPEEGKSVIALMEKFGLKKHQSAPNNVKEKMKVYMMCEVPSNVVLAEEFLDIFDGMSIGSNDLTQLALGMDRDNAKIAYIGDERNPAVKEMIRKIIKLCRKRNKYCGICGQAPSDYSEFAEFLVKEGIESISLNPDTVIKTILILAKIKK